MQGDGDRKGERPPQRRLGRALRGRRTLRNDVEDCVSRTHGDPRRPTAVERPSPTARNCRRCDLRSRHGISPRRLTGRSQLPLTANRAIASPTISTERRSSRIPPISAKSVA
jgi:hypothetical protein